MKYVVIRTDSERNIEVIGKTFIHDDARTMLRNDFEEWLRQKWSQSPEDYDSYLEEMEEYGCYNDDECSISVDEDTAWLNSCYHTNFDWTIVDTETEDILTEPMSMRQLILATSEDGTYIGGNIIVSMDEIINNDLEGFLDIISDRLVGSPLLMDINYKPIDTLDDGSIILHVMGDVSEILEINEDFCKELKNVITNAGPEAIEDFIGMSPLDYHVEKDLDNILESTIDQMPGEKLIRFYQKYAKEV